MEAGAIVCEREAYMRLMCAPRPHPTGVEAKTCTDNEETKKGSDTRTAVVDEADGYPATNRSGGVVVAEEWGVGGNQAKQNPPMHWVQLLQICE